MTEAEPRVPQRIIDIARHLKPPPKCDDAWNRRVEAEILPEYRADFDSPYYDRWIELLLRSIEPLDSHAQIDLMAEATILMREITKAADPALHEDLDSLAREIAHRFDVWKTDWLFEQFDRPRTRPHATEIFRDKSRRNPPPSSDDPLFGPPELERLPDALSDFAFEVSETRRTSQYWNALREYVYPHFNEAALTIPPYREFLAIAIRHYAEGQTDRLIPRLQSLIERLENGQEIISAEESQRSGIDVPLLEEKCDDLLKSIKRGGPGPKRGPAQR